MDLLRGARRIGIGIGAVTLGLGIVLLFLPELARSVPLNMTLVGAMALVSLLLGGWSARRRYRTQPAETFIPDVEFPLFTPTPGEDIDELVYRLTERREGTIEYREQIRDRIAEAAIGVVSQVYGCSRDQAIEKLETGEWTEDELAATFFTSPGTTAGSSSILDRIQNRLGDEETAYERQLRATIDAIESVGAVFEDDPATSEKEVEGKAMEPEGIVDESEGEWITEDVRYRSSYATNHWVGITSFALVAFAVGVLTTQVAILLASAVAVTAAGYSRAGSSPPLVDLEVRRDVSDEFPQPGDEVTVTVTAENTGDTLLPDLRLIDRVPPMMTVVDGTPRTGTALRPGGKTTFQYRLVAERGVHSWPLQAVGRDISGSVERDAYIIPETGIECLPSLKTTAEMPVRMQTSLYTGEVETPVGGEGLEFFSLRDYQPGDPRKRIDWKTYARTGEFKTVEFREERAARTVLLFDCRESAYTSAARGEKHALDHAVDVSFEVFASLFDQGHLVGIAAFDGIPCWLGPNTGDTHLQRVRRLFVDHPALSPLPPDLSEVEEGRYVDPMRHIRRQLPENTQIFLFSPLTDGHTHEVARRLDGGGHLVTVVSPDPTATRTIGQRLARIERKVRVRQLRDHGIRVIDWSTDQPLNVELEYARRRWEA